LLIVKQAAMAVINSLSPRIQLVLGVLVTTIPLWLAAWHFRVRHPLFVSHAIPVHNAWTLSRETFIQEWLENQIGSSPNVSSISYLCRQPAIKWRPNIVLDLDDANGGIGNVRGNIFDFISLAILTGSSIMLPRYQTRSSTDLSNLFTGKTDFDTFFDEHHFTATFATACPKMEIYKLTDEHPPPPALPNRYGMPSMRHDLENAQAQSPQASVADFNNWLIQQPGYDASKPALVKVGRSLWDGLDPRLLPAGVRRDFGGSLRLTPQVRRLAAIVTYNLARRYRLHDIDPRLPYYPVSFLGAHLRTESDASKAGWLGDGDIKNQHSNYTGQINAYLSQAVERNLPVIYVASGNASEISRFTEKAWSLHNFNVTSKLALLSGTDLDALNNLSWDQQGLVDYEVLRRSTSLAGFAKSSFALNIAITRNEFVDYNRERLRIRREEARDQSVAFDDGLSKIWGRNEVQEAKMLRGAWP
jgi:hypothetical protein